MLPQRDWTVKPESKLKNAVDWLAEKIMYTVMYGFLAVVLVASIWMSCTGADERETKRQAEESARRQREDAATAELRVAMAQMNEHLSGPGLLGLCVKARLVDPQIGYLALTMTDAYVLLPRSERLLLAERLLTIWRETAGSAAVGMKLQSLDGNEVGSTGFSGKMSVRE